MKTDKTEEKNTRAEAAKGATADEQLFMASQWRLMWWKFLDHRLAVASAMVLVLLYLVAVFCEFLAPHNPSLRSAGHSFAPPQRVHLFHEGSMHWPFVYPQVQQVDPDTLRRVYVSDRTRRIPISFFVKGDPYKLWALIPMDRHFIGLDREAALNKTPTDPDAAKGLDLTPNPQLATIKQERDPDTLLYLMGADILGRDLFSRILYGSRISLSIGLVGVFMSLVLGVVIGGISGYYGGRLDVFIQRIIEILRSFPSIPLWLALSAAMPATWSQVRVYFCMTLILALIGWTGLARVVRGKILSLREEDYAMAAQVAGVKEFSILMRHLIPGFLSHLIVSVTLAIPGMVMAETSLSFLRLGLRPPTVSWGVLLQDAQNAQAIVYYPWLLWPIAFVIVTVLMFNFMGDGLRDAADPYSH
ncbi:MAG: ABC transporter permease [bacterium]|nr:ABC transporter permease [bacterium]